MFQERLAARFFINEKSTPVSYIESIFPKKLKNPGISIGPMTELSFIWSEWCSCQEKIILRI